MSHDVITSLIGITRKCNYTHDHVFLIYITASLLPLCQTQTVKLNEEISKPAATFEALGVTRNFYFSKKKKKQPLGKTFFKQDLFAYFSNLFKSFHSLLFCWFAGDFPHT